MWGTIGTVLTSKEFLSNIPAIILLIAAICIIGKLLKVQIKTDHIQIGGEPIEAYYERKIVQEQSDYVHTFLMGLISKITVTCTDQKLIYDGWMTKCILEMAYDEFVDWIHYNHISEDDAYISVKQNKIKAIVYSNPVREEFRTKEFEERIDKWVAEIIHEFVRIRRVYKEQMKKKV